jgi:hypothetical protein
VIAGDPKSGLLPRVEPKPPGEKGSGDNRVQTYNFRVCLTDIESNRVPIEKPVDYNPLEYELLARHIATMKNVRPGPRKHAAIGLRGNGGDLGINFELVPNRKTDSNCGSEFGTDMIGASYKWPEGDYATRDKIFAYHKTYTLGLLWFLGHDERLPREVRTEMQRWGLPKDEFQDTGHFPHQIYVREARRMIGDFVVTENDARGTRVSVDSIALASYPLDSHGVTLYVDEQGMLYRERGFFTGTKPFPISYKALRPRAGECDNLLVISCLSASHAAYGSLRMEPVFMMIGHAAGAAASLAVDKKTTVQEVPYADLRDRLIADKQILQRDEPRNPPGEKPQVKEVSIEAKNERLESSLKALVERSFRIDADYWRAHAVKGVQCDGEKVAELFQQMAKTFQPMGNVSEAISVLIEKHLFSSREYWTQRAVPGGKCSGDLVAGIVEKFAVLTKAK